MDVCEGPARGGGGGGGWAVGSRGAAPAPSSPGAPTGRHVVAALASHPPQLSANLYAGKRAFALRQHRVFSVLRVAAQEPGGVVPWAIAHAGAADGRLPYALPPHSVGAAIQATFGGMLHTQPHVMLSNPVGPHARMLSPDAIAAALSVARRGGAFFPHADISLLLRLGPSGTYTHWTPPHSVATAGGEYATLEYNCFRHRRPTPGAATDDDDDAGRVHGCGCRARIVLEYWAPGIVMVRPKGAHNHVVDFYETRHFPRPTVVDAYHHNLATMGHMNAAGIKAYVTDFAAEFETMELAAAVAVRNGEQPSLLRRAADACLLPHLVTGLCPTAGVQYSRTSRYGGLDMAEAARLGVGKRPRVDASEQEA